MQNFELTKHQVTEVNFRDNGRQKKGESSFDISGSVLLPKDGKGTVPLSVNRNCTCTVTFPSGSGTAAEI